MRTALIFLIISLSIFFAVRTDAAKPSDAVKFFIVDPSDSVVGVPVVIQIEARKQNNQVDTTYQNDITLVASGSATGEGLVDVVNGIGTKEINDTVPETVVFSLSDTELTGLDVTSTQNVVFGSLGSGNFTQTDFWFRDNDGGETGATGWGLENIGANILPSIREPKEYVRKFRLRFGIRLQQENDALAPQIEYKRGEGSGCADTNGWQKVNASDGKFVLQESTHFSDMSSTTQQITAGSGFVAGLLLSSTNPASSLNLLKNEKTEYEWSLEEVGSFAWSVEYIFRVTNNGVSLNNYQRCPRISFPPEPRPGVPPTTVTFSGTAYPGAKITIIEKDERAERPVRQEPVTTDSGNFSVTYRGIFQSEYSYGLVIEDKEGRKTQAQFYTIDTVSNSLTQKDIFLPPTVGLYRTAVTKGDFIKIIGYASPGNTVLVQLEKDISYKVNVDDAGKYQVLINTARLSFGKHSFRAKQQDAGTKKESEWSPTKLFSVVAVTVPEADFTGDGVVDVKDWSVFLFRWQAKSGSSGIFDLNRDGKMDISDLSVFLQTFRTLR
ncbi:MAG: hypothetical protein A2744_04155 [Candidatus Buchananbacteria bacterium RIFCSPHIGHO2_01_FULL_44_11]|uniref:Dockerin domain-containing protein n=1 Tax=Candidatus Buchananbacteria bacterium RIFCSPHIGHO2_01_FULL_44_11 TaxID=1797535 RepID=A0A1G1Y083_9BACT|nr:MAG: hypothetical protein A2744_04155 [Candidatus Buchananbacteria bacterium RIFCSPHIGHO2_01_FULL_44_11]